MHYPTFVSDRRTFVKTSAFLAFGAGSLTPIVYPDTTSVSTADNINIIGPQQGFSPHIGTLVSMMNWMREIILYPVQGLSVADLDYIHDQDANSIGAMLLHLAATERFYQIHTFEGRKWGDWDEKDTKEWRVASGLGDEARQVIKGHDLNYYLTKLQQVREASLKEFARRDDAWLMKVDQDWPWGPTNNYCKWFHVCEHESNHNGQVKWIKSRLPSAKKG